MSRACSTSKKELSYVGVRGMGALGSQGAQTTDGRGSNTLPRANFGSFLLFPIM